MQWFTLKEFRWTGKQYKMWKNGVILTKHSYYATSTNQYPHLHLKCRSGDLAHASRMFRAEAVTKIKQNKNGEGDIYTMKG